MPLIPQLLRTIYRSLGKGNTNLPNLRIILLFVLRFMGFLRFPEVINLKYSNMILKKLICLFLLEKEDLIYTERATGCIYLSDSRLFVLQNCLGRIMKLQKLKHQTRQIYHSKQGFKLKNLDKPINYTTVRYILLTNLMKIGLDKTQFGLYSLRSRRTTVAANFGINDRLFQKCGRWKPENVKNGYVHENLRTLLSVFKNLGV